MDLAGLYLFGRFTFDLQSIYDLSLMITQDATHLSDQ